MIAKWEFWVVEMAFFGFGYLIGVDGEPWVALAFIVGSGLMTGLDPVGRVRRMWHASRR